MTPATRGSADQRRADLARRRAAVAAHAARHARLVQDATAWAAISGVSSAGLASTALPAASAAATWPVKIASGKFHGLMQTTAPSGAVRAVVEQSSRASAA